MNCFRLDDQARIRLISDRKDVVGEELARNVVPRRPVVCRLPQHVFAIHLTTPHEEAMSLFVNVIGHRRKSISPDLPMCGDAWRV